MYIICPTFHKIIPQSDPIYIWNSNFPCATSLGIQATSHPVVKIV